MCYFSGSTKLVSKEYAILFCCRKSSMFAVKSSKYSFLVKGLGFFYFPTQMFLPIRHNTNSVDLDIELIF